MPNILISGGDPAGIGPELFEESFSTFLFSKREKIFERNPPFCFIYFNTSSKKHEEKLEALCQKGGLSFDRLEIESLAENLEEQTRKKPVFIFCTPPPKLSVSGKVLQGEPDPYSGHLAFRALEEACNFALNFGCDGMLTLPLSKEWVCRSGESNFRGHTDYLAERFGRELLMLMRGLELSVIPLTVHIPLKTAPRQLKKTLRKKALPGLLREVRSLPDYQEGDWALCAFNPHAGENGLMGSEEKFLKEFSQKLRKQGISVDGPLPADSLFMPLKRLKYRLILSCYHDQGLIPFKALEGTTGVNCTIGLPFLRTSPDHGPAFDLAGQKKADTRSMYRALELCIEGFGKKP